MRLKSIFTNSFGILFSRITGLGRDVLMASALGASIYTDMFFIAFKLPNLFRRVFAEGAFTQAFMPSFVASKRKGVFATAIFLRFMLFIFIISLIVTIYPELITKLLAWGWSGELISKTAPFTAINFWYLDFIFMVTFMATLLQYREHFATTAISTALLNISMISAMLLYMNSKPEIIVYALSFGVVIGGFLQLTAHLIAIKRFKMHKLLIGGWRYREKRDVKEEERRFSRLFLPSVWGNSAPQISSFLDTFLASFLITGSVSYLFYANRVFQLPLSIIAIATATALFPSISKALNRGDEREAYSNLSQAFWLLALLLGVSVLGGMIFAEPIVWLLFERGAFSEIETLKTVEVLRMYMIGLLPYGFAKLFSMFLYASQKHGKAAKIATIALIVNMVSSFILIEPLGAMGLALAGSIGGWTLFILTIKEVGLSRFIDIIKSVKSLYFFGSMVVFGVLFIYINGILVDLIRG
jgi:putative peptidoglycan lipid II flippase